MDDAPKSAYELAMERLRKKDAESGEAEVALTEAQKAAITEARQVCAARTAQAEILHRSRLATTMEAAERQKLELEYRHDITRLAEERDAKISRIRRA